MISRCGMSYSQLMKSCELRYTETMVSYGALQKLNDAVLGIFLSYFKRNSFIKCLK